jgi:secreted trypsin-like serine protease
MALCAPAAALVGGAAEARGSGAGRHIVMIVGGRGNLCTGTALAQDLILTAGHCVAPAGGYRVITPEVPTGFAIAQIAVHPRYSREHYAAGKVTADVALIKLAAPLPGTIVPAGLGAGGNVAPGERFTVAGFGTTAYRSDSGVGVPRAAALSVTGRPGNLQIRLFDPATANTRAGLGACTGDSGGPLFREGAGMFAAIGVVSWSTGPNSAEGCGGLTGVTPLTLYRPWIVEQARKWNSTIVP